jgi:hypothetical protein
MTTRLCGAKKAIGLGVFLILISLNGAYSINPSKPLP